MRVRNLFYLLLALPLVFAACTETPDEPNVPVVKEPVLTLTSEATMEFTADGGAGEITYTLENEKEDVTLSVECTADWVTDLAAGDKVTFTVAANDVEEARETKIIVKYDTKSFEVAVKQAAKNAEPVPPTPNTFEYELVSAERMNADDVGFTLYPYDFPIEFSGAEGENSASIALWLVGEEGDMTLQAGEYSLDADNVILEYCAVFAADTIMAEDVTVTVDVEGDVYDFDITIYGEDGNIYHATYSGEVENMSVNSGTAEEFVPVRVSADLFSAGNFMLQLWLDDVRYHELDMYDYVNPNSDYLSEGLYRYSDGSIGEWSVFSNSVYTTCPLADAEVTLTINDDNSVGLLGYIVSSEGHHITFDWTGVVEGFNFGGGDEPIEEVVFEASFFGGEYYSGSNHNYYIVLSDTEVDGDYANSGATYYYFDLYSDVLNADYTVPNGVYTFDPSNSYASGTFTEEYGWGFKAGDNNTTVWYIYAEGSKLTVSDGKIVAELILEDGFKHIVTYEGNLSIGGGDDTGGGDTAEGDIDCSMDNAGVFASYFGQWYGDDTDDYLVEIYEDGVEMSGKYLCLELLCDYATCVDYRGTFELNDSYGINTALPGYVDGGYLAGCWYAEVTEGAVSGAMVAMVSGSITVTFNGDGSQTFVIDCVDADGNKISGEVTGSPMSGGYAKSIDSKHGAVSYAPVKKVVRL